MTAKRARARAFGLALEWRAALWLVLKGYRILARNYLAKGGEVDLIALSPERWIGKGAVCFVEVRGRIDVAAAQDSVDPVKQARIAKAARVFLAKNPRLRANPIRYDVIAAGRRGALIHTRNAFDA